MYNSSINRLRNIGLCIFIVLLLAVPAKYAVAQTQEIVQKNQLKFARLLRLVDGYYVDSANVDKLTENAIVNLLGELDPHSTYISKEQVDKMNEPLKGNFEGIGISFNIYKDTLLVNTTISGGPSEKVGLRAGDRIIEVDGKEVAGIGLKNSDVFDLLKGKKGTEVNIRVLRKSNPELLDFKIIRDKIPIFSLDASYMLDKETGYIKLNKFSKTTTDEFEAAIKELKQNNLQNLILDLRGNGGGYLHIAHEISDQFLENDKLIVYTEGSTEPRREYKATGKGTFKEGNLVVLVDESSASASEIVSGAVQDWDRGVIIGRRSFGKGLVQKPFMLTDGSMVRLTTAHYYTPSGRCIQKSYEEGNKEYRKDYMNRLNHGEMFNADSIEFDAALQHKTLLNGRNVYGGGGIMPDIFVPIDTSRHYQYTNSLRRKQVTYNFVLDYVDRNREKLSNKYSNFEEYYKKFDITDEDIDEIIAKGEKEGIEKNEESLNHTKINLKQEIKALIARDLFSRSNMYEVLYANDDAINKALEVIENQKEYENLLVITQFNAK